MSIDTKIAALLKRSWEDTANKSLPDEIKQLVEEELQKQADRIAHKTEDGYCCACEYDITVMEGKLLAVMERYEHK